MQNKLSNLIIYSLIIFISVNLFYEVSNTIKTEIKSNDSVPNLDSNCYYTKNQIISFFNGLDVEVVDIVKYSHDGECAGKVIGSNLIPGNSIDANKKVFITSNVSVKSTYFSYPILESIVLIMFLFILLTKNTNKKNLILIFLVGFTYLNINSFVISSYRHNKPASRIIQNYEYSFENHLIYSDPKYFVKTFDANDN